ncbi:NAD(P)/FAD-dependent oxidoreductase [Salinisphaera sp. Q1T1-3]|nr:NAD(P)/FAD-dependent oxidoreductase [Salinisphaera sp. Q1T1-3]
MNHDTDVVVLGGGAAGLMCAAVAAGRGRRVVVLEKTRRCGKKILMSGGGRCNFTNLYSEPANFLSANPHYCKSALARYTPADFLGLVEAHGVAWHEKERGQLFCDHSAKAIVRLLLDECAAVDVTVRTEIAVETISRLDDGRFAIVAGNARWQAASVVVATGGLSIPRMGGSGFGMEIAERFGLPVRPPRAGLVPFTLDAGALQGTAPLSGLSIDVEASCGRSSFDAGLLFTHRGLSGPAMLQVSSYWSPGASVTIDWLPTTDIEAWLAERAAARPQARLPGVLAERLPKRLAVQLCQTAPEDLGEPRMRQLDAAARARIAERLGCWRYEPNGTEGYKTAEVMLGGVDTRALDSATMAARDVPGLYFVGEVVDVTGHLGGHNFQWAWASGWAAGQVV